MQWRPVVGCEGVYDVSENGQVWSRPRVILDSIGRERSLPGKSLSCTVSGTGYAYVRLYMGHENRMVAVHKLVAEAFLGRCPPGQHVAHWDGDKLNNTLGNLRYVTPLENAQDRDRHGRTAMGEGIGTAVLTDSAVLAIRQQLARGCRGHDLAEQHGVSYSTIRDIARRRTWRHLP